MSGEVAALVFAEGVRSLQDQATALDGLRSRAGILLSAASLVTSFFSGIALGDPKHLDVWGWVATGWFVLAAGISISILYPRQRWSFTSNPTQLVVDYLDVDDVGMQRAHRNLALFMGEAYSSNKRKLETLFIAFEVGCTALAFEVVFWFIDIARG